MALVSIIPAEKVRKLNWNWRVAPILLMLCASVACSQQRHPAVPGENYFYQGYLKSGEKFSVVVGEERVAARSILESHHIQYIGEVTCDAYLQTIYKCRLGQKADAYSLKELARHGSICLEYESGVIVGIAWDFYLLPYIDT